MNFGPLSVLPEYQKKEASEFGITDSEGYNYPAFMGMELISGYLENARGGRFYESDIYNDELNRDVVKSFDIQFLNQIKYGGEDDKVKDSKLLIEAVSSRKCDYVISLGQRPNIKDKVYIETTAVKTGGIGIDTDFDCEILKDIFEESGIIAKISHNAGSSFCNSLYFNGLKYIYENGLNTKMVFVHIPYDKNISCFENFHVQILCVLEKICFGMHI